MPMFWKRKVIEFKSETTYGTDSVPTNLLNAVLGRNVTLKPLETVDEARNVDLPYVGHQGTTIAGQYVTIDFEVEMAGAGAAGTAPGYGSLLKAAGMSETITPAVSAVYAPVAPGSETSGTLYFYMGGRRHKMTGCLANCDPTLAEGKSPFFKFSVMGLFVGPDDQALPVPTLTAYQKPLAVNNVNTTPATLHGFAGKLASLSFTTGNVLNYKNAPNVEAIRNSDRQSTGSIAMEDELVASKDWWTIIKSATLGALSVTHGTVAGNKVTLAAPNVQLLKPTISQANNVSMLGMTMQLLPSSAGNDEFSITVT